MNEHKNIITIEDEIKEFSDKPVKSSALYKKAKELESNAVPNASEASVGDVLTKGEDGIGWSAPSGGGSYYEETAVYSGTVTFIEGDMVSVETEEPARADLIISIDGGEPEIVPIEGTNFWMNDNWEIDYYHGNLNLGGLIDGEHTVSISQKPISPDFVQAVDDAFDAETIIAYVSLQNVVTDTHAFKDSDLTTSGWTADDIMNAKRVYIIDIYDERKYVLYGIFCNMSDLSNAKVSFPKATGLIYTGSSEIKIIFEA